MTKVKTTRSYLIAVSIFTVIASLLPLANVAYFLALPYLLPMSLTIEVMKATDADSISFYFVTHTLFSISLGLIVFSPLYFRHRFRGNRPFIATQVIMIAAYLILSAAVFSKLGSWTSV